MDSAGFFAQIDVHSLNDLFQLADQFNAFQLRAACMHFARNM
jgi:hypothetical protein